MKKEEKYPVRRFRKKSSVTQQGQYILFETQAFHQKSYTFLPHKLAVVVVNGVILECYTRRFTIECWMTVGQIPNNIKDNLLTKFVFSHFSFIISDIIIIITYIHAWWYMAFHSYYYYWVRQIQHRRSERSCKVWLIEWM